MATRALSADAPRASCGNSTVISMPGAARRKVQQSAPAVRAYRAANPWPGDYALPAARDAQRLCAGRSPIELALIAIVSVLAPEQRVAAKNAVHRLAFLSDDDAAVAASRLMASLS